MQTKIPLAGVNFLATQGLNLFAVLDVAELPDEIKNHLPSGIDLSQYQRLIVIGNGGAKLWESLSNRALETEHPIDTFSLGVMNEFCKKYLSEAKNKFLYPSEEHIIPLQRIGNHLSWSSASPLGIGISKKYGLWWAFRAAFLSSAELTVTTRNETSSPCEHCIDKPCISHCPGAAISEDKTFSIPACFKHRAKVDSSCLDRCLSRIACPIACENQYPMDMTKYIYRRSMAAVIHYVEQEQEK